MFLKWGGREQACNVILGPFSFEKWGVTLLLLLFEQKTGTYPAHNTSLLHELYLVFLNLKLDLS